MYLRIVEEQRTVAQLERTRSKADCCFLEGGVDMLAKGYTMSEWSDHVDVITPVAFV